MILISSASHSVLLSGERDLLARESHPTLSDSLCSKEKGGAPRAATSSFSFLILIADYGLWPKESTVAEAVVAAEAAAVGRAALHWRWTWRRARRAKGSSSVVRVCAFCHIRGPPPPGHGSGSVQLFVETPDALTCFGFAARSSVLSQEVADAGAFQFIIMTHTRLGESRPWLA